MVYVDSIGHVDTLGDIVVLAIPYGAVSSVLDLYKDALKGKIIVDLTNPFNFETMDDVDAKATLKQHLKAVVWIS